MLINNDTLTSRMCVCVCALSHRSIFQESFRRNGSEAANSSAVPTFIVKRLSVYSYVKRMTLSSNIYLTHQIINSINLLRIWLDTSMVHVLIDHLRFVKYKAMITLHAKFQAVQTLLNRLQFRSLEMN
jgi:hypothetical protein